MRHYDAPTISSGLAHILAWVTLLWLAFWPTFYQGASAAPATTALYEAERRSPGLRRRDAVPVSTAAGGGGDQVPASASLTQVNGFWVLGLLAVPLLLTALGLIAAIMRHMGQPWGSALQWRLSGWTAAALLLGFCAVGIYSIGLFYLPVALLLLVSAALPSRPA
jgi:hypothetical protein